MSKRSMVIFPETYPYKNGDQIFISNEIKVVSSYFKEIEVIHFGVEKGEKIIIPANLKLIHLKANTLRNKFSILKDRQFYELLSSEFSRLPFKVFIKKVRFIISSYKIALEKINVLKTNNFFETRKIYYSFWMNDSALLLAIAKSKGLISKFIFRLHGYDLYDEYRPDNYIPFRDFIFKNTSKAFTVSEYGFNYLKPKLKFPERLENSYLGSFDCGINPLDPSKKVLVSCSSINIRKRVHLIIEALSKIKDINITWYHFGGKGDWGDKESLEVLSKKSLPSNILFYLMGSVSNVELMNFYKIKPISAFIHLSETEGGPSIACVEAISFGIPLIATTVGGLKETVNIKTGFSLSKKPDVDEVTEAIRKVFDTKFQNQFFREGVKKFWATKFDAETHSREFKRNIIDI